MDNKKTIKPGNEIISSKADSFRKKFLNIIEQGVKELEMEFSGVKTIDSIGLGMIIATNHTFENAGGTVAYQCPKRVLCASQSHAPGRIF